MPTEDARKLFVAGLPESMSEEVLRQLFEAAGGTVEDVSLPRDRATGRPRGFGFVTLSTAEEAASVRGALDGSLQAGRSISVRPFSSEPPRRSESPGGGPSAGPSFQASEDRTLYVGNLPYDTSQQELQQLLESNGAGPVARVHLPVGPDGRVRGFGFVTMATADAANSAIVSLRGVEIRGRRLMVNIAHPRGAGGSSAGGRAGGPGRGPREPQEGAWPGGPRSDRPPGGPEFTSARPDTRRSRGGHSGSEGWDEESRKPAATTKKKGPTRRRGDPSADRGGGGSWQSWKWDDDD